MRERDSFGYMEPSPDIPNFAQCGSCRLFIRAKRNCYWFNKAKDVDADDACIMYVQGANMRADAEATGALDPKVVSFAEGKTRCENCNAYNKDAGGCHLFYLLSRLLPRFYKLKIDVKPRACCNAYERGSYSPRIFTVERLQSATGGK